MNNFKVLVHLHLYHFDMWEIISSYLSLLENYNYDLYVTIPQDSELICSSINKFKNNSVIEVVKNNGFDVGPFIFVLSKVNLSNYDFVIKLHTKRTLVNKFHINYFNMKGNRWKKYLFSFISSKNRLQKSIEALNTNPSLGMVADRRIIADIHDLSCGMESDVANLLKSIGLPSQKNYKFIAGTMFICKAKLLIPLKKLNLTIDDFKVSNRSEGNSLAHIIERFLGAIVYSQGYEISDPNVSFFQSLNVKPLRKIFYNLSNFIFQDYVNSKDYRKIKVFLVTIYKKKITQ